MYACIVFAGQIELVNQENKWSGPLKIGLTSCDPSLLPSLPSLSTQLPANTWIMSGTTIFHNGRIFRENYGHTLSRLQVHVYTYHASSTTCTLYTVHTCCTNMLYMYLLLLHIAVCLTMILLYSIALNFTGLIFCGK